MSSILKFINFNFIAKVVGAMCLIECIFIAICIVFSLAYGESDFTPFLYTFFAFALVGVILTYVGRHNSSLQPGKREAMLGVTLTWLTLSTIGMCPFIIGGYTGGMRAFFETISGFTTTGFTVFSDVESLPHGILLWRSITQWQGGIGIVVFTIALLPILGSGAGLLYDAETTGVEHERFLPRITSAALRLWLVYLVLTIILILLLCLGGMDWFESICHAFSGISTGGFSTRNGSIGVFDSFYIEVVLCVFMFIASLDFTVLYFASVGKMKRLFKDEQFRWFLGITIFFTVVTAFWLFHIGVYSDLSESFRRAVFQVFSFISTTGYITADINLWMSFFWFCALFICLICGCAGSTSGGIKVSRFIILIKNLRSEFKRRTRTSIATSVKLDGVALRKELVAQVLAFFFLYLVLIVLGAALLTLSGNDFVTAIATSVAAIGNVGACFGGYSSGFEYASTWDLSIVSFLMLAGRLEVFTVVSLFSAAFWKR